MLAKKIREDPVWFVREILKREPWEKEIEILESVRDNKEVAVRSCHSSGKTFTAATLVHWFLTAFPESIVLTTAPTGRQVKEILWREIKSTIPFDGYYPPDRVLELKIDISPKHFALGLATDKVDQFQGFHASNMLVIVDEASGVSEEIFRAIYGLNPSRILMLGNPLRNTGRFADAFKDSYVKKIHISAFDTPNVKKKQRIIAGLITLDDIERIKRIYGEDSPYYQIMVLGNFPSEDNDSYIQVHEITAAIERKVEYTPYLEKKMGVDPARYGQDSTAIVIRQDNRIVYKELFNKKDTMEICGLIIKIAKEYKVMPHNIAIDIIGLGAGVYDRLREQGWFVNGVNVNKRANNPDKFKNIRIENWDKLKQWLKTGSLDYDEHWYEICNLGYHFDSRGKLVLESKEDLRKRNKKSPNLGDAVALTFSTPEKFSGVPVQSGGIDPYYDVLNY